jgi:hypothetical protein
MIQSPDKRQASRRKKKEKKLDRPIISAQSIKQKKSHDLQRKLILVIHVSIEDHISFISSIIFLDPRSANNRHESISNMHTRFIDKISLLIRWLLSLPWLFFVPLI